jgi:hypothetical protein
MKIGLFGLIYGLTAITWGASIYGPLRFFAFLTSWCTCIQTFTFALSLTGWSSSSLFKKLVVVSWSLGWSVCVLFWTYVYPLVDKTKLTPAPLYLSTHGGLNLVMTALFLKTDIHVKKSDFWWAIAWPLVYSLVILLPLKMNDITIYPMIFDGLLPTLIIFAAKIGVIGGAFSAGKMIKDRSVKKD